MQLKRQIKITLYQAIVLLMVILASGMSLGAESAANLAARSQINRLQLSTELTLKEANILNLDGTLTEQAVKNARLGMKRGETLNNPSVVKELTKDGSKISDWQKLTSESVELSSGQRVQVHFYKNTITNEINYTHTDFKVKNAIDAFYNKNSPSIVTPQDILNKYR